MPRRDKTEFDGFAEATGFSGLARDWSGFVRSRVAALLGGARGTMVGWLGSNWKTIIKQASLAPRCIGASNPPAGTERANDESPDKIRGINCSRDGGTLPRIAATCRHDFSAG